MAEGFALVCHLNAVLSVFSRSGMSIGIWVESKIVLTALC